MKWNCEFSHSFYILTLENGGFQELKAQKNHNFGVGIRLLFSKSDINSTIFLN